MIEWLNDKFAFAEADKLKRERAVAVRSKQQAARNKEGKSWSSVVNQISYRV